MLFLMALLPFNEKAIHVSINDPIIDFNVTSLSGETYQTSALLDSGFVIFLSLTCPECVKGIDTYKRYFTRDQDAIILMEKTDKEIVLAHLGEFEEQIYFVSKKDLKALNVKVLPAMLGYRDQKLKIAFHGPLNEKNALMILDYFNR